MVWLAWSQDINSLNFFLQCYIKSRMYHDGKPEARHQLGDAIDEASIDVRNEL